MRLIDSITQYPGLENLKNMTNAWNKLIAEKSIPFDPEVLKEAIGKEVKTICLPKNGKKVLKIEKKGECYTRLMSTKYPVGHYEIALAVFIQKLNDSCYAQFTLTGNTENWDILNIYSDNSAEFIELKEWDSKDSPLFALVEALKNFELYNHISKLNKAQHTQFSDSSISILAPIEYYIKYNLFSPFINKYTSNEFSDLIKACKECFKVDIHLKALYLSKDDFNILSTKSDKAEDQNNLKKADRERATVANITFSCPELLVENWKTILS